MTVKLILATGSRAGFEETLQQGYYMIGRHKECQIRPKTHSVSRRHCLLHFVDRGIRVFDLGSTNGTSVNDRILKPNEWVWLSDGDELRCGKIAFRVDVKLGVNGAEGTPCEPDSGDNRATSLISGGAWQDFDIAEFLEAEDEAEREERYGSLRQRDTSGIEVGEETDDQVSPDELCEVTSLNLVGDDEEAKNVLEEARRRAAGNSADDDGQTDGEESDGEISPRARRIAAIRARIDADRRKSEREHKIDHQISRMLRPRSDGSYGRRAQPATRRRTIKAKPSKQTSEGGLTLYAAVLIVVFAGSMFTYSVYRSASAGQRPLVTGID